MRDTQFELELDQRRKEAGDLREQLAPRRRAEAEVLTALEAARARHVRDEAAATEETATNEQQAVVLRAQLEGLQAGLSGSRRLWVRIVEPWLLSTTLFTGLVAIGLAPRSSEAIKASGAAVLVAGLVSLTARRVRGR